MSRCRKTYTIEVFLTLISSDANRNKTGIIELCLMLTSSDAVKRDMEFYLMLISSDTENRCHGIFSDVNIIRCRKTDIIEFCLRFISSDVQKHISLMFV